MLPCLFVGSFEQDKLKTVRRDINEFSYLCFCFIKIQLGLYSLPLMLIWRFIGLLATELY